MSARATTPSGADASLPAVPNAAFTRAPALRVVLAGAAAAVPTAILATVAVLATPHARGIGFFPALRFAVLTPACFVAAIAAAFASTALAARSPRPRARFAALLGGALALVVVALAVLGPSGLAAAAILPALVVAVALTLLVPRALAHPRSRVGAVALVVFGALELVGVVRALASERVAPHGEGGLAFEVPRALFDVDHHFVDLPGGARVHYVDEGSGETLLFLHGNPSWSFQWRDLIARLKGSYRCVALDYPGFGLSDAPPGFGFTPREESLVVEAFVDHLGLRDVTLVMQDWGGPIGLGLAGRRPELVRRVVVGSTWAWPTTTDLPRGKFSAIVGGPIGEFAQVNFDAFASFGIENGIVHRPAPGVLDVYLHPFRPLDRRGIAAFYPGQINAATPYFEEVLAGLARLADKPALIFWAGQDRGFVPSDRARFEAAFPKHTTIDFPDANHFFFEDTLDEMVPAIRTFMDGDARR